MPTTSRAAVTGSLLALLVLAIAGCSGDRTRRRRTRPGPPGAVGRAGSPVRATTCPVRHRRPPAARPRVAGDVATGLSVPWGLAFLPDGTALVSERDTERVKAVDPSGAGAHGRPASTASTAAGEGGLLGLAVSPDYATDSTVFAYFTRGLGERRRPDDVRRRGALRAARPCSTASRPGRSTTAAGSRSGPTATSTSAPASRAGPTCRRTATRSAARSCGSPRTATRRRATRSPARRSGASATATCRAWRGTSRGQLWAAEFGQNTWDELNRIEPGENYGWPEVEGRAGDERYVDPVRQWRTSEASPERHRGRGGLGLHGRAARHPAVAGPHPRWPGRARRGR